MTTKTSLKATKQATAKPSKAEIVLQSNQLLAFAPIVQATNDAFILQAEHEQAGMTLSAKYKAVATSFCQYMSDIDADYPTALAYKKHLFASVAEARSIEIKYVQDTINPIITKTIKEKPALAKKWFEKQGGSAESNRKARNELASIVDKMTDTDLSIKIESLAKAGDKDSLKRASQLATERDKRKNKALAEQKKAIKASVDDVVKIIKATVLTPSQVACLSFAINNMQVIEQVMREKGVNKITDI